MDGPSKPSRLAPVLLGTLIALTLLAEVARWVWVGELVASFRWHLGWTVLALVLAALLLGRRKAGAALALALALGLWHVVPEARLHWPRPVHGSQGASWTLVSGNLRWRNGDDQGVRRWLAELSPDVVVAQEVSPRWREVLAGLAGEYPHQIFSPPEPWGRDEWGTAVLSRVAFDHTRLIDPGVDDFRSLIEVGLKLGGEQVVLRSAHPIRPAEVSSWRRRNLVLGTLAGQLWPGHSLLVGDLNTTSTSPILRELLAESGLRDSRRGFGRQPTFSPVPHLPGVRVAIDHVLVGASLQVLERRLERIPGSDHRGVFVRLLSASDQQR